MQVRRPSTKAFERSAVLLFSVLSCIGANAAAQLLFKEPHTLGIEHLRVYRLPYKNGELAGIYTVSYPRGGEPPGVLALSEPQLRELYKRVSSDNEKRHQSHGHFIIIVARLPGRGTDNRQIWRTEFTGIKAFEQEGYRIAIKLEAGFSGPFSIAMAPPTEDYVVARIGPLSHTGKYDVELSVEMAGSIWEKLKDSDDTKLPKYPRLETTFEIVEDK